MSIRNLNSLLLPKSVALVGASMKPGSVGRVLTRNLQAGYKGKVFLVNPKYKRIHNQRCWAKVEALPEAPELAVVCTPAATVPNIVRDLGKRGACAAIIISAGFAELHTARGNALQQAVLDAAKPYNMRIAGPNCIGLQVPDLGLNASFASTSASQGRLAFITQSSALLTSVLDWACPRGIGFSHLLSLGNMADVDFGDMLDYLAGDGRTRAILLYIESVAHARKFLSAARAAARIKPVVVVKGGRHAEAVKAAASQNASPVTTDAIYDAAFRRAGMLRVSTLGALFGAADILTLGQLPRGKRLAILTNGGGIGVLATDALMDRGGQLATLSRSTLSQLKKVLPPGSAIANPVEIIGTNESESYQTALDILRLEPDLDAILTMYCPTGISDPADIAHTVLIAAKLSPDIPIITCWVGGESFVRSREMLTAARIPTFETPEAAVQAFMYLADYRRNQDMLMETPPSLPDEFSGDIVSAHKTIHAALADGREWLNTLEAMEVLKAYDIPAAATLFAPTPTATATASSKLAAPFAVKIISPQVTPESDFNNAVYGLNDPATVQNAAEILLAQLHKYRPNARCYGFAVQSMLHGGHAYELTAGITEDQQFGPCIFFGQGGTAGRPAGDKALGLPPLNMNLANAIISNTHVYKLLQGGSDKTGNNLEALALTLVKLSQLAADLDEISSLEIDPLQTNSRKVAALDARIRVRKAISTTGFRFAIKPYPKELESELSARDGQRFRLRPIVPEDEPALHHLFSILTPEEIRLRFHVPMKAFPHSLAARFTQIDYNREMALVLSDPGVPGQSAIHGVVRMSADPDNERAEFALLVRHAYANQGLGTQMLKRILDYARHRHIGEMTGMVLLENKPMRAVCRHLGFSEKFDPQDNLVVNVRLPLR